MTIFPHSRLNEDATVTHGQRIGGMSATGNTPLEFYG